jgi:hypothetical protein
MTIEQLRESLTFTRKLADDRWRHIQNEKKRVENTARERDDARKDTLRLRREFDYAEASNCRKRLRLQTLECLQRKNNSAAWKFANEADKKRKAVEALVTELREALQLTADLHEYLENGKCTCDTWRWISQVRTAHDQRH